MTFSSGAPLSMPALSLSADLPPALVPLAWLLGTWEGVGVGARAGEEYQFGQRISFAHDGRDFLAYDSTLWHLDAGGNPATPDARETGFWRVTGDGSLEVLVAHATGVTELYVGRPAGPRIELVTDFVARTPTAEPYTSARRLYGSVEGDLLYAHDAAYDRDGPSTGLAPLRSARLRRTTS